MCKLFDDWTNEIKKYCDENGFDFEAAKNLSQSWNSNTVVLYHCIPSGTTDGLLDDTPSPMVLLIRREKDGSLSFERTEHTEKFLKKHHSTIILTAPKSLRAVFFKREKS